MTSHLKDSNFEKERERWRREGGEEGSVGTPMCVDYTADDNVCVFSASSGQAVSARYGKWYKHDKV